MDPGVLVDLPGAMLVLTGTMVATVLRCGPGEARAAAGRLAALVRPRFSQDHARSDLARQIAEIRLNGLLRADLTPPRDTQIGEAIAALVRHRSLTALLDVHRRQRHDRQEQQRRAVHLFDQAGDLAPVFGLAGTLVALSQLSTGVAGAAGAAGVGAAISTAVLTTLYGLVVAHLVIFPLARVVERHGDAEEKQRQDLIDWLTVQLADANSRLPGDIIRSSTTTLAA